MDFGRRNSRRRDPASYAQRERGLANLSGSVPPGRQSVGPRSVSWGRKASRSVTAREVTEAPARVNRHDTECQVLVERIQHLLESRTNFGNVPGAIDVFESLRNERVGTFES